MIRSIRKLLKPAQHLPEITDPKQVKKLYKYWRVRTFYSIYVGYLFYYFTRKSFTFVTPFMVSDLNMTKGEIGLLVSILSIAYAVSKFTSGIVCDRSNPRFFMAIGLILTGVFNVLFGFASSVWFFALFWGLNGWFQGWGWPACTKQLTYWYSRTERGTWWSIATTSHTVGGFLIAYVAAYSAQWYDWRFGMFIPGVIAIISGVWLLNRLRDVPRSLGLPTVEQYKKEPLVAKENTEETLPVRQILFEHVLCNKYVWVLAISYFFIYVVRIAVNDWGPLYLTEMKDYHPVAAAACVSWFEIGGFFGILVAGWGSDYWFDGKRVPMMVLSSIGLAFSIVGLWYVAADQFIMTSCLVGVIGFLVFGPQMLVGLAAAEFVSKKAASTSNGFAGCLAYLGAAMAGYPLGVITDIWGWQVFLAILVVCSILAALVLFPIWSVRTGHPTEEKSEEIPSLVPGTAVQ